MDRPAVVWETGELKHCATNIFDTLLYPLRFAFWLPKGAIKYVILCILLIGSTSHSRKIRPSIAGLQTAANRLQAKMSFSPVMRRTYATSDSWDLP